MRCIETTLVVAVCAMLASCSGSSENPLAGGLTPELQALLIERSIEQIEFAETFTHDNFEQIQRHHLETMAEDMRDVALENLQKRLDKITILDMSQTVQIDRDSAEVESRVVDRKSVRALVLLKGTRSYHTNNASKTLETRLSLPWVITVDGGELVFRHRGIRMRDITN